MRTLGLLVILIGVLALAAYGGVEATGTKWNSIGFVAIIVGLLLIGAKDFAAVVRTKGTKWNSDEGK